MKKNYFEIKEKKEEIKTYKIILCDLLILINHCIKYRVDYENLKKIYLDIENRIDERENVIKKLESEDNV